MQNDMDFSDRSALITGAASGIGAASAKWLDARGISKLILIDKAADGLAALDLSCETERHDADVSDESFWDGLDADLQSLDHAIVNAGIGAFSPIADHSFKSWRSVMNVNLDGAFLTLRTSLRAMKKTGGGSAVLVASITGQKAVPAIGVYGVAKAGILHMARIAAAESASQNIRVNAIAPGAVDTAIWDADEAFQQAVKENGREAALRNIAVGTPRGKVATAAEIAGNIGYLLSDAAANITGTVQISDGGYSL